MKPGKAIEILASLPQLHSDEQGVPIAGYDPTLCHVVVRRTSQKKREATKEQRLYLASTPD